MADRVQVPRKSMPIWTCYGEGHGHDHTLNVAPALASANYTSLRKRGKLAKNMSMHFLLFTAENFIKPIETIKEQKFCCCSWNGC